MIIRQDKYLSFLIINKVLYMRKTKKLRKRKGLEEQTEESRMIQMKKQREFLVKKISDPKTPHKVARKIILKNFPHDTQVYQMFFQRSNLTKGAGLSFCLEIKDPNNWFLLFRNPNVKFSIPELLFWAIRADEYANLWRVISTNCPSEYRDKHLSDFSILTNVLKREDVKYFFENSSIFNLVITGWRLRNRKVWDIIEEKEEYVLIEEDKAFPINVGSFLFKLATFIPISLFSYFLSLGIDVYLENKYKNTKPK